jgi:lipopolysaccharide heptosyltransferase II
MTDDPRNILVLEAGGIGDAVMATPALDALRTRFPDAHITVAAAPRARDIVKSLDIDVDIVTIRVGQWVGQAIDVLKLAWRARRLGTDLLIDLSSIESRAAARRRLALAALIGAPRSIGRNTDGRGGFFDDAMDETLTGEEHEVRRKLAVLAPLGISVESPAPRIGVTNGAEGAAALAIERAGVTNDMELIGINPGSALPSRRWPVENFQKLAAALTSGGNRALLVTGGRTERYLTQMVAATSLGPVVHAVRWPLTQVAAAVRRCRLFVTNDTGMMHIAAAMDTPVVGLFGRTNMHRYQPWLPEERRVMLQRPATACPEFNPDAPWHECRRNQCPNASCMSTIALVIVQNTAQRLLERTAPPHAEGGDE